MYSKTILNLFANPVNAGRIMKPDGIASLSNFEETANVEFSLRVENDIIQDCNFRAQANPYITAICSTITQMVIGKNIDDVMLDQLSVKNQLGDNSETDISFCIECLYLAIEDYIQTREKEGKPKSTRGRKKKVVEPIIDEQTAQAISDAVAVVTESAQATKQDPDEPIDEEFGVDYIGTTNSFGSTEEENAKQGKVEDEKQNQSQPHVTKAFEGSIFNNPIFVNFFNHTPKGE